MSSSYWRDLFSRDFDDRMGHPFPTFIEPIDNIQSFMIGTVVNNHPEMLRDSTVDPIFSIMQSPEIRTSTIPVSLPAVSSSMIPTAKVVIKLKSWLRAVRQRKNETLPRNNYYQFMMDNIFNYDDSLKLFFSSLENVNFLTKDSVSDSICFTALCKPVNISGSRSIPFRYFLRHGVNIFVKMTQQYASENQFKEIEPALYRNVINGLVQHRRTPHMMMYLGHERVKIWYRAFRSLKTIPVVKDIKRKFENIFGNPMPHGQRGGDLLVTECGQGQPLKKFMDTLTLSDKDQEEFIKILFQIFYTLEVMDHCRLTHYDLHLGNIFLEDMSKHRGTEQQYFIYFLTNTDYVVLPLGNWFVRLFDWDMGYEEQTITASQTRSRKQWACPKYGMCNTDKSEYDVNKVLMLIYDDEKKLNPDLNDFIRQCYGNDSDVDLNKNIFKRRTECNGRNCRDDSLCEIQQHGSRISCNGEWKNRPNAITSIGAILDIFIETFNGPGTFASNKLPSFDPRFLPGTHKWMNYVFSPSRTILSDVKAELESLVKHRKLVPIEFK